MSEIPIQFDLLLWSATEIGALVPAVREVVGDAQVLRALLSPSPDDPEREIEPSWSVATEALAGPWASVELQLSNGRRAVFSRRPSSTIVPLHFTSTATLAEARAELRAASDAMRTLARAHLLSRATLSRRGSSGGAPSPALSDCADHGLLISPKEIETAYGRSDALSEHGWDTEKLDDDHWLLTRALDAVDDVEFESRTGAHQWALARIAPPNETRIGLPDIRSEEMRALLSRGEPTLLVSYSAEQREQVYTGVLSEGTHVRPWEIWQIQRALLTKKTASGEPVERVRVVFEDRATAEREKRPLLDVGAVVQFLADDGPRDIEP